MKNEKILFLGDVYLNNIYKIPQENCPVVFNLEAPLTNRNTPIEGKINLKSSGNFLKGTFKKLPIAVSLANNHIMDYGNNAFIDTIKFLEENNVKYFGAGDIQNNYNNPLIININKFKVGFLGYCYNHFYDQISHVKGLKYGPAPLVYNRINQDVFLLKNKCDRIVVQLHWGTLFSNYPEKEEVVLARQLTELGANIVLGHHAHTIQPIEKYGNSIIAYNLGNFIFPDLNLPTYYSKNGQPKKFMKMKQREWHNSSAGIEVDLNTLHYSIKKYYRNKNKVEETATFFHKFLYTDIDAIRKNMNGLIYKNLAIKKILERSLEFVENPRLPSKQGLKDFLKLFTEFCSWR